MRRWVVSIRASGGLWHRQALALLGCLLAVSCGGPGACSASPPPGPSPTSTTTRPPVTSPTPAAVQLHVTATGGPSQGRPGIHCPMWDTHYDSIVLAQGNATYTATDIAAMRAYFLDTFHQVPPATLRVVPGVMTASPATVDPRLYTPDSTSFDRGIGAPACALDLQVTNTGDQALQIGAAGFRLSQASQPNTSRYALVEACSVGDHLNRFPCPIQRGGGPGPCGVYTAHVSVGGGAAGATFEAQTRAVQRGLETCPELTISSGQTIELWLDALSASAVILSVVPYVVVTTARGTQRVEFPELADTMAFGDPSQFTCAALDRTTGTFQVRQGTNAVTETCA
jgi:hypothetical protein